MLPISKIPGNSDLSACFEIRRQVFIIEQQVPENLELDGLDTQADHYLIYADNNPIGTARVRFPSNTQAKIERVAILFPYRGKGFGRQLVDYILQDLRQQDTLKIVTLGAQLPVIPFYEKLGFIARGEVFLDANIEHRLMDLEL